MPPATPATPSTRFINVPNGDVILNVALQGEGPLVVCVHGWPELWYSWRHQMAYFAQKGYQVAAMDVRGYGRSSKPTDIASYTMTELTGDVAAVIEHLTADHPQNKRSAIVLGHDWGAPIAWNTARLHPHRVSAVAGLSVPYFPTSADDPIERWRELYTKQNKFFYQVYFADNVGGAEAELAADSLASIRKIYFAASGDAHGQPFTQEKSADSGMLDGLVDPDPFPSWCTPEDLQVYADAMDAGGWHGPLHRYRAQPLDAKELGWLPEPNLKQPAIFIGGEFDVVRNFSAGVDPYDFAGMACDDFRGTTIIDGAGHWVQQEAPEATNAALETFFIACRAPA